MTIHGRIVLLNIQRVLHVQGRLITETKLKEPADRLKVHSFVNTVLNQTGCVVVAHLAGLPVCFSPRLSVCLTVCLSVSDAGSVLKVVSIAQENWSREEVVLEELQVFQVP